MSLIDLPYRILARCVRHYQTWRTESDKRRFAHCGPGVELSPDARIWGLESMHVGKGVCIRAFTHIFASGGCELGDHTRISTNCSLATVTHPVPNISRKNQIERPIKTGKYVWIGTSATILPGVTIGDYSIVGAGSVVTKDVPPCVVVAGNPARIIRHFEKPELPSDS